MLSGLALAGSVLAPLVPAHADGLETEFDKAFVARPAQPAPMPAQAPQLQASQLPAPRIQQAAQPTAQTTKRTPPAAVRPYISNRGQRSYSGALGVQVGSLADDSQGRIGVAAIDLTTAASAHRLGALALSIGSDALVYRHRAFPGYHRICNRP